MLVGVYFIFVSRSKQASRIRFIYYKTTGDENINDISKRFFADDKFLNQIRELNSGKIDDKDYVAKDTEILLPFNPYGDGSGIYEGATEK